MKTTMIVLAAVALAGVGCNQSKPGGPSGADLAQSWRIAVSIDPQAKAKFSDDEAVAIGKADALLGHALQQIAKNDNDGAEYKINEAMKLTPSKFQVAQGADLLGLIHRNRQNYGGAAAFYTVAIEKKPGVGEYHLSRAYCKIQLAKEMPSRKDFFLSEAEADLREAVRLDSSLRAQAKALLPSAFP